jgi:hypothetical protein
MNITVSIEVTNPGKANRRVTIAQGDLIEVNDPGMQNVMAAQTVTAELQPGETRTLEVPAYCLNKNLKYPENATGKMTKWAFVPPASSQSSVWSTLQQPANPNESPFAGLRREMVRCLRTIQDFEMFADDFGFLPADIAGDTITAKCYDLIGKCRSENRVEALLALLRNRFPDAPYFHGWSPEPVETGAA